MSKDIDQCEHAARFASTDLETAKAWARKPLPEAKRVGRSLARLAKRRRVKANRRAGKLICDKYTP